MGHTYTQNYTLMNNFASMLVHLVVSHIFVMILFLKINLFEFWKICIFKYLVVHVVFLAQTFEMPARANYLSC